jgi:hypothetical protein
MDMTKLTALTLRDIDRAKHTMSWKEIMFSTLLCLNWLKLAREL